MGKLRAWIHLSRLPFQTVGILPFILGSLLVWQSVGHLDLVILGWGTLGVAFILFATYFSGEYFDYEVDSLSAELGRNRFSGGSQVLQAGTIPRRHALVAAALSLAMAFAVGILLQFYYKTGAYTLPLGVIGMFGGVSYSAKPIKWAYRGIGELWIGFCYGWLTVATAYYIQTRQLSGIIHWAALPIAFSIINVILINEFPDYAADIKAGKRNLTVRFGKGKISRLYVLVSVATWFSFVLATRFGIPDKALLFSIPVFLLSVIATFRMLKGGYENHETLEKLCATTLIINLGVTASLILGVWL